MNDTTIAPSELHMARFLAEAQFEVRRTPWKFHALPLPEEEMERREYDYETERLRRFIRGQQITEGQEA